MGWDGVGGEREAQEEADILIPLADSCWYMAEMQKPTQYCKVIIHQLKINIQKEWGIYIHTYDWFAFLHSRNKKNLWTNYLPILKMFN